MKKGIGRSVVAVAMSLSMALCQLPALAFAVDGDPTVITTAEQFAAMDAGGNYKLGADITVDTQYANEFSGTFNGDGHTITLDIEGATADLALFKTVTGDAVIENVITDGSVTNTASKADTAGLVAWAKSTADHAVTIRNCMNKATISGNRSVGGLVGQASFNLNLDSCANLGTVTGSNIYVGGVLGQAGGNTINVTNCYNQAAVTGFNYCGGVVGNASGSSLTDAHITNCYNTGAVTLTSTNDTVGALAAATATNLTISNCYALEGTCANLVKTINGSSSNLAFKTETEMKAASFVTTLGSSYMAKADSYPALKWETPTAPVAFSATPAGATLTITKSGMQVFSGTVGTVSLAAGSYAWTISKDGYVAQSGTVSVTEAEAEAATAKTVDAVTLAEDADAWTNVTFNVAPASATLEVKDGEQVVAPASGTTYKLLKSGHSYTYTATAADPYEPATGTVDLTSATNAVTLKAVQSISVSGNQSSYYVGDELTGLTVTANYGGGDTAEVTGYTTDFDSSAEAEGKVVTVTYKGITTTFTADFAIKPGPTAGLAGKAEVNLKSEAYGFEEADFNGETVLASTNKGIGNSSSGMTITATKAGMLSFKYAYSSETRYDWLNIKINGTSISTAKVDWSGSKGFTEYSVVVSAGDVVTLLYTKDSSGNSGEDTAWLKDFAMSPVYKVTFNVTPATAAVVLKKGEETITPATDGTYTVVSGEYTYTASAFGYTSKTDTITVSDKDVTKDIELEALPGKKVTFSLTLPADAAAADATIEVKSGDNVVSANADGSYTLPAGDYTYRVTHAKCEPATGSFTVADEDVSLPLTLTRRVVMEDLFPADTYGISYTQTYAFEVDHDNAQRIKTNNQGKSSSTASMTLTMKKSGILSFSYDVSSELSYDKFSVKKNGTLITGLSNLSGEIDWTAAEVSVVAGDTIEFIYSKDSSGDRNDDTVWLKDFVFTSAYDVTFSVTPADATVVLAQGDTIISPVSANAYSLGNGTYSYTASAFGYSSEAGEITVADANVEKTVTLTALPKQAVTFNVTAPEGFSAADATITVKDASGTQRDYAEGLPAGEYTYAVALEGCETATGSFTVADEAVAPAVTLRKTLTIADFFDSELVTSVNDLANPFAGVYDEDGNYLVSTNTTSGSVSTMTITAKDDIRISLKYKAWFSYNYEYYNYLKISKNGQALLNTYDNNIDWKAFATDLDQGDILTIEYKHYGSDTYKALLKDVSVAKRYPVTIAAPPGTSLVVKDASGAVMTGTDGSYSLSAGQYTYQVSKFCYETISDSFTVADQTVSVTVPALTPKECKTITVQVDVEGASVAVFHDEAGTVAAQDDGTYLIPTGETISCSASKEGYISVARTVVADQDKTVAISLETISDPWDGTTETACESGDGTAENPYAISNAAELAWFAAQVRGGSTGICGKLVANIDLNGKTWSCIGSNTYSDTNYYSGTFNGQGHTVTGLNCSTTYAGLFGRCSNATIENVNVQGVVTCGGGFAGGVVARADGTGAIANCTFDGSVSGTSNSGMGGIVGQIQSNGAGENTLAITGCVNYGAIITTSSSYTSYNVGGIAGYTYGKIVNCVNMGVVKAESAPVSASNIGGLAGALNGANSGMENCYDAGKLMTISTKAGALVGASTCNIVNCYYLADTCERAAGSLSGATAQAEQVTAAQAKSNELVIMLGADYFNKDTDGINSLMPVLKWQGGTEVVDEDGNAVKAALEALELSASKGEGAATKLEADGDSVYNLKAADADRLVLPTSAEGGIAIAWSSSSEAVNAETGAITFPESGVTELTLTATLALNRATRTKAFSLKIWSDAAVSQAELDATASKLSGKNVWASQIANPDLTNFNDAVAAVAASANVSLDGMTIEMVSAGEKSIPAADPTVNLADDGTITYFTGYDNSPSFKYAQYNDVTMKVARGEQSSQFTVRAFISWDAQTVQSLLNTAAASVSWDGYKGANTAAATASSKAGYAAYEEVSATSFVAENMSLPQKATADGLASATAIAWSAENIAVTDYGPAATLVSLTPGVETTACTIAPDLTYDGCVELTGTLSFNLLNEADGSENLPTAAYGVSFYVEHDGAGIDTAAMQQNLEQKYTSVISDFYTKEAGVDLAAVTSNLQMPTPATLEQESVGIMPDRSNQKVVMTSSNTDVVDFYGYQAQCFRPLPSQGDATVDITVKILNRTTGVELCSYTFPVTVKAFTQAEIDADAAIMERVCTESVYVAGLLGDNTAQDNITGNMHAFTEITWDSEGNLTYVRGAQNVTFAGIKLDDLDGWYESEKYREIRSSNPEVITHENLQVTLPTDADVDVTLDSVMTYYKYAMYWERYGLGDSATAQTKAAYAQFEQFYKQPISATFTVKAPHVHTLIHHAATEAAAGVAGNIEYWQCTSCAKCYSDAEGLTEIDASSAVIPALDPGDDTPGTPSTQPADQAKAPTTVVVKGVTYKIAKGGVKVVKVKKSLKKATIQAKVTINGKSYKVVGINGKVFKGTKVKTITIKTKKLSKKSVKKALKGSKVKTVKVKVSSKKKTNKKFVKKYKKIFTKKNCGKKVAVK